MAKRQILRRSVTPFISLSFGFFLLASFAAASYAQDERVTVVRVGLLIDGSGGEPIKNAVIVIKGKRIEAVGRSGDIKLPQGTKIIDLRNKVAILGLVDAHSHYREWMGELYVNHGVTTALDIGAGVGAWTVAQRDGINKGLIVGPRLLWGPRMNAPSKDPSLGEEPAEAVVTSPEQARKETQRLIAASADLIKALENLTTEQLKVIVEEAHRAGKRVVTHSINGPEAVFAGVDVDSIEHSFSVGLATVASEESRKKLQEGRTRRVNRMTTQEVHAFMEEGQYDRVIQALVKKGVHWTPTLANSWRAVSPRREKYLAEEMKLLALPGLRYVPSYFRLNNKEYFEGTAKLDPKLLEDIQTGYRKTKDLVLRFAKAGGKLQTGSDPNSVVPGLPIHYEMEIFVEAGLSPMEALVAATRNTAERLDRDKDFGMIAPGRFADIVIINRNPLEDISATREIDLVFQEGKAIKPAYHAEFRNPIRQPFPDREAPEITSVSPRSVKQGQDPVQLNINGKELHERRRCQDQRQGRAD